MSGLILVFAICVLLQGVQGSLRFRQDGTFRIVQFTDLHYGEGEDVSWGPRQDANSNRVLHSVLDHEDVDLVVYTGDLITGNNVHSNATSYWKELLLPSSQRGLKFATLFGNHDDLPLQNSTTQSITSREQLHTFERSIPGSITQRGPDTVPGVSNYVLTIQHSRRPDVVTPLYFLDTGGGTLPEQITDAHVDWYINTSQHLASNYTVSPGVAYFHIPAPEYLSVRPSDLPDLSARHASSASTCFGMANDGVNVYTDASKQGLIATMAQRKDVVATFVGHDHGNDWVCKHASNIWLGFGRHSGYGGYGKWARGARVVVLNEQFPNQTYTYVRMEDGANIDHGYLNV
eukprot:TRINITY_DN10780_c0_g2_i1.p2 TRINITY_DN10780_c0_g2~~TRINITY_DN10780_c0_g2_i1.p2  ORF type:complete len:346 (+),score=52.12 TRINITY_DN10780_c0_g2_i1:1762-2799(+)